MDNNIHVILTGGTIEKTYDPITEKPEFHTNSVLPDYLKNAVKAYPELTYEVVSQIDSMDMRDDVRADILKAVEKTSAKKVLVVHGTGTMKITANFLSSRLKETDKNVILTGAMIPLKEFAMSDAGFNLGFAIAQLQFVDPGVYVAMNSRLFKAGKVTKNAKTGRFEEI